MAFHALADYQNHVIGWLQWEQSSLGDGAVVRFPRIWMSSGECRLGRVGRGPATGQAQAPMTLCGHGRIAPHASRAVQRTGRGRGGVMSDERKLKHLEFIQGVINRLSTNSFLLKGWSVVLVSALFALSAADSQPIFALLACIPAFVFWGLDGFFLWQEKLYRDLYDEVRQQEVNDVDFSMSTNKFKKVQDAPTWLGSTFSTTLFPLHSALIAAIVLVIYLMCVTTKG